MNIRTLFLALAVFAIIVMVAQPAIAQGGPGPSNMLQLKFTSQPPQYARVGVPYVYTAQARSMDSTAVVWYVAPPENPLGFAIDSATGVVTWTPAVRGWFQITIMARAGNGMLGVQRFVVTVTAGNGIVQGKVTDTLGAGIPQVVVEVLQAANTDPNSQGCYAFVGKTDNNGNYRITNVDPGVYKLHANSPTPQYASQWYDGKASATEADRITVLDAPSVAIANFVLRGGVIRLPQLTVTGTVTDTAAAPLKDAKVFFVRAGFALNSNGVVEDFRKMFDLNGQSMDFRMEGNSPHVFRTSVDSLGDYSIKLPPGLYIAFARAPGYAIEYYFQQSNILTATRLPLRNDTTGINFTLSKLPLLPLGTINGSVLDTAKDVGVRARIIAFRDRWLATSANAPVLSYTTDTDSLGVYSLQKLLPGWYYVLALPVGSYAPAFYSNDSLNTRWHHASRVYVNGNTVNDINIYVREIPVAMRGYTGIIGKIRMNAGTISPPPGTFVYAIRNGAVAGYGIADGAGQYEINGLAPGTYTVTADYPGFDLLASQSATVSYTSTGIPVIATVDLNVTVTTDVTGPSSTQPESFLLSQNYPNPFNPTTVLMYQLTAASRTDLRVYDLLGREVAVLVNVVQSPGMYTVTFDASSLPSGVYLYRLSTGTMTATRKMVLMK